MNQYNNINTSTMTAHINIIAVTNFMYVCVPACTYIPGSLANTLSISLSSIVGKHLTSLSLRRLLHLFEHSGQPVNQPHGPKIHKVTPDW